MELFVANISFNATEADLKSHFEEHGQVDKAQIITDRDTGRSKGFGFVSMPYQQEAEAAINALDQQAFMGRNLAVRKAEPRSSGSRGAPRGNRRY